MKRVPTKNMTITSLVKAIDRKNNPYNFNHPLQRKEDQWTNEQKTLLIDSLLRGYTLDPIRVVETMANDDGSMMTENVNGVEKEKIFNIVIDGKQRGLSTIYKFVKDGFKLHKCLLNLRPITLDSGVVVNMDELVGKKFSELSEEIQNEITECEISIHSMNGVTDWDMRQMFDRQNNGKALTKAQRNSVVISPELYSKIQLIEEADGFTKKETTPAGKEKDKYYGNFWERNLSGTIFKNGEDRNIILATLMLISKYGFDENGNIAFDLKNENYIDFISWFENTKTEEEQDNYILRVIDAADTINRCEDFVKPSYLRKTSIPMFVAGMDRVIRHKEIGKSTYIERVINFFNNYDTEGEYAQSLKSGSADKNMVQIRWNTFKSFTK